MLCSAQPAMPRPTPPPSPTAITSVANFCLKKKLFMTDKRCKKAEKLK